MYAPVHPELGRRGTLHVLQERVADEFPCHEPKPLVRREGVCRAQEEAATGTRGQQASGHDGNRANLQGAQG